MRLCGIIWFVVLVAHAHIRLKSDSGPPESCRSSKSICEGNPDSARCSSGVCMNRSFAPSATITSFNSKIPVVKIPREVLLATTREKTVLEIGGPTPMLRNIGFYEKSKRFDNVVEAEHKEWAADPHHKIFTNDYRANGAALQAIVSDASYDTVVSSHNIEHFPDVLRALMEWHRVLKPAGQLVLIIPYGPHTFDHKRTPHNFDHLLGDYVEGTRERYTCDLNETFQKWDVEMDSGLKGNSSAQKRAFLRSRFYAKGGDNFMHWHVFTPGLVFELAECLNMSMEQQPVVFGSINMLVILRK